VLRFGEVERIFSLFHEDVDRVLKQRFFKIHFGHAVESETGFARDGLLCAPIRW
jgi:hypothetical protein